MSVGKVPSEVLYEKWENISLKAQLLQTLYLTENQRRFTTTCNIEFSFFFRTHKALSHTIMGSDSVNAGLQPDHNN